MIQEQLKFFKMRERAVRTLKSYALPAFLICVLALYATMAFTSIQAFADEESAELEASSNFNIMFRLYNRYTGEHFYTSNTIEKTNLVKVGWTDEGIGWFAPKSSKTPVYRLYNKYVTGGDHHYTTSTSERDTLKKAGWSYEGVGWYSNTSKSVALYRQYNRYAKTGTHNYSTSKNENDKLVKAGWKAEGTAWYGVKPTKGALITALKKCGYEIYEGNLDVYTSYNNKKIYCITLNKQQSVKTYQIYNGERWYTSQTEKIFRIGQDFSKLSEGFSVGSKVIFAGKSPYYQERYFRPEVTGKNMENLGLWATGILINSSTMAQIYLSSCW